MGLLDRVLGQPGQPDQPGSLAQPGATVATLDTRTIGFAAARIDPTIRPDRRRASKSAKRSDEMWNAYEGIGEVGYIVDFFGNALRRCRMFPAGVDDPKDGRIPLEDCTWASDQLAADAAGLLERVRSVEHGQGEVFAQMAQNLKVAGDGNLYAQPSQVLPDSEDWQVLSTSALVWYRGQWCLKLDPDDRKPQPIAGDQLWRFWQRHARWPGLAYSELTRVLGAAETLQLLERAGRNRNRARVAGPGVLFMSNRVAFKAQGGKGGFFDDFLDHMTTPMKDEASVSSFAPMLVDVDTDDVTKAVLHQTFSSPLTELEAAQEERLIRRIGQGMDAPPELATGYHDVKFANGLIIKQETYEAHVEPLALRIADILAVTVVRAGLIVLGHPAEIVARVTNGVDPTDLVQTARTPADVHLLHKARAISDGTYRQVFDFEDEDAPDDAELARRVEAERPTRITPGGDSTGDAETASAAEVVTAAAAASNVTTLGARLQALDLALTASILGAAEHAVQVALDRAAGRVRNQVRRTEFAGAARGDARGIFARIDPGAFDSTDIVTDADFDQLHDTWIASTTATYSATAGALTAAAPDAVLGDHTDHIDAGWAVLLAGLLAATRTALTTPADQPLTEAIGETDPQALVQPGVVRHAISRAGGALGSISEGGAVLVDAGTRPAGGIATGENLIDAATQAGLVLTGWTWHVGAPPVTFPPHHDLEGVEYSSPTDSRLTNDLGQWPGNAYFYPQDHVGCRCTAEPNFVNPENN